MIYALYRAATYAAAPFIPLLLARRLAKGKEDRARINERRGYASLPRPAGKLVWIHAASVGEANAALPVIDGLLQAHPALQVLLTTVTVTSAALMSRRLPPRARHQFVPVDTPGAVTRFLHHWRPDLALWVDSELWPNLIFATQRRGVPMALINARMSARSCRSWQRFPTLIARLLHAFTFCYAQSEEDSARLQVLGMTQIRRVGNLKYDAPALTYDTREVEMLLADIKTRPLWLAASTHPGEEAIIARVHARLVALYPQLLTLIVPRHAKRGDDIAQSLQPMTVAQRSKGTRITSTTQIYIADTMGELGLFYHISPIAFIGGSLVAHGGQNPLEAARLSCAIISGPHTANFADIYHALQAEGAAIGVQDEAGLLEAVQQFLGNPSYQKQVAAQALQHMRSHGGVNSALMNELQPYLA